MKSRHIKFTLISLCAVGACALDFLQPYFAKNICVARLTDQQITSIVFLETQESFVGHPNKSALPLKDDQFDKVKIHLNPD